VRQQLALDYTGNNPFIKAVSANDLKAAKKAQDDKAKAEEAAYLAKKAAKAEAAKATPKNSKSDGLDDLLGAPTKDSKVDSLDDLLGGLDDLASSTPKESKSADPVVLGKDFQFPSNSEFKAAKKVPFGDPLDTLNAEAISTANIKGQEFFIKGNPPLENPWKGWDNIDRVTMEKQLKSEVATKAIADLVGVGEYYLPIKEYGRGQTAKVVTPFIEATPAWRVANDGKFSMPDTDRRKLLALDYAIGALDRHGGNIMVDKEGKPYMIDNGLNFGKHLGAGKTKYGAWTNNSNFLIDGMNILEPIDRSHIQAILDNKAGIIKIAKAKGLDYRSVGKRIDELAAAETWRDII
jgi:hypothetical protein